MPTQSGRPGPAVAKQKGDMKVNPSTSHDPQQSPPSSLSSSHCAQRQRGRSGCLGGISVLAQAWCVHGLTSNVTASSGVIVADAARQQAPGVHPSHLSSMKVQETIFPQSFVSRVYGMPVLSFLTPDFIWVLQSIFKNHLSYVLILCGKACFQRLLPRWQADSRIRCKETAHHKALSPSPLDNITLLQRFTYFHKCNWNLLQSFTYYHKCNWNWGGPTWTGRFWNYFPAPQTAPSGLLSSSFGGHGLHCPKGALCQT